jgi:molecular chaperone DnaK (HSP70)
MLCACAFSRPAVQQRKQLTGLGSGVRRFMVIDMGGGTVDMTLHKAEVSPQGGDHVLTEVTHRECLAEVRLAG